MLTRKSLEIKFSWKLYTLLGIVFFGSFLWAIVFPSESIARQLVAIPGTVSLIGVLYQLVRDEAAYQKSLLLQKSKHEFDLAITSHMANVAFDRHVLFCEEYLSEMHNAIVTLFQKGECVEMLQHAWELSNIKVRHRAWLTQEIESGLEPFESALRQIGAAARFYKSDPGGAVSSGKMDQASGLMFDIFGYKKEDGEPSNVEVRDQAVIQKIRKILGIEELKYLRYKQLGTYPAKPNQ